MKQNPKSKPTMKQKSARRPDRLRKDDGNAKKINVIRWTARILGLAVLLFGLPFYFGYGNPLPFINPAFTLWDNVWLTVFPIMFIGLILGWKWEKAGGYVVSVPLALGLLFGLVAEGELVWFMLVPLLVGALYLFLGYQKKR